MSASDADRAAPASGETRGSSKAPTEELEGVVRAFAARVDNLQREMARLRAELESLDPRRAATS